MREWDAIAAARLPLSRTVRASAVPAGHAIVERRVAAASGREAWYTFTDLESRTNFWDERAALGVAPAGVIEIFRVKA